MSSEQYLEPRVMEYNLNIEKLLKLRLQNILLLHKVAKEIDFSDLPKVEEELDDMISSMSATKLDQIKTIEEIYKHNPSPNKFRRLFVEAEKEDAKTREIMNKTNQNVFFAKKVC